MNYRSRDVVEAIQYTGSNEEEIIAFLQKAYPRRPYLFERHKIGKYDFMGATFYTSEQTHQIDIICGDYLCDKKRWWGGGIERVEKEYFEAAYAPLNKFPKEAYELVDDFCCMMMNESPVARDHVLTELIVGGNEYDRMEKLVDALERIKRELGGTDKKPAVNEEF